MSTLLQLVDLKKIDEDLTQAYKLTDLFSEEIQNLLENSGVFQEIEKLGRACLERFALELDNALANRIMDEKGNYVSDLMVVPITSAQLEELAQTIDRCLEMKLRPTNEKLVACSILFRDVWSTFEGQLGGYFEHRMIAQQQEDMLTRSMIDQATLSTGPESSPFVN